MKIVDASPKASSEIEMLSKIGYNLNSAISDIIDNSIHALHLKNPEKPSVFIDMPPNNESPSISICDNGIGMDESELRDSMRIGCKNPNDLREEKDLGRFGSGMKTASFSQASQLIVLSKKLGKISAASYDLDRIKKSDKWDLEILDEIDIKRLEIQRLREQESGTLIIWNNLTKYTVEDSSHLDKEKLINSDIVSLQKHLSHFFHRFMGKKKISFFVNDSLLKPFDPFLTSKPGYQEGAEDTFRTKSGHVFIKYHIIPHVSKLSAEDLDQLGGKQELTSKQGLYVYRADRLIIEGEWLGIAPKTEMSGLVRIEVDINTSMDKAWAIDVKKSQLQIPETVKTRLKALSSVPRKKGEKEFKFIGVKEKANHYWLINENSRENIITYEIDTQNKEIKTLVKKLDKNILKYLHRYLRQLALNLPLNHIANSVNSKPKDIKPETVDESILVTKLEDIWKKIK